MKGHLDAGQLKSMDYKSLQALAKDMGVNAAGKAEDIIARIAAVEVDVPEDDLTEEEKALYAEEERQGEERAAEQAAREQEEAAQAAGAEEKVTAEQKATAEAAAGLVKVKAVTRFLDKRLNQIKEAGEAYNVNRKRAAELVAAGVAEIVG